MGRWIRCVYCGLALATYCFWLSETATVPLLNAGNPDYTHLQVRLLYPEQGRSAPASTLFRCLVHRQREQLADDATPYYLESSGCRVCLELDNHAPPSLCWRPTVHELDHAGSMQEQMTPVSTLSTGNHSAHCFVDCANVSESARIESERVWFTVVQDEKWAASTQAQQRDEAPALVIGVKSSVTRGLPRRQAARETWASVKSLPSGVRVVFLGCRAPLEAIFESDLARRTMAYAIDLERRTYGDLLVDELDDCEDSYEGLVGKVTAFLRFVTTRYAASAPAVMIADDDVYIDVNRLTRLALEHLSVAHKCAYAGQVWEKQFNVRVEPVRDRRSRYYVSEQAYPMKHWPPFAFGPHYLLSASCLGLIRANQRLVGEFRGLDDISIAMWLLARGVRPLHVPQFKNLRDTACFDGDEGIVSLADLSITAIRAIHHNLASGRPFCHGSDLAVWLR